MHSLRWFHIQWGTYGSWLPGDPRGFRSRDHRIYSGGDYKQPPAPGEHAGLHEYAKRISKRDPVELTVEQRSRVRLAIIEKIERNSMRVVCFSVSRKHVHLLGEFSREAVRAEVGKLKRHSSHAVRDELPGALWSAWCHPVRMGGREHLHIAYQYILDHEQEGAAIHSFWDPRNSPPPLHWVMPG